MEQHGVIYKYGTSGFRYNEKTMINISEKIGIGVGIVALMINNNGMKMSKKTIESIGVMITASHNVWTDNGIKIVDNEGDMISTDLEKIMEDVVNNNVEMIDIVNTVNMDNNNFNNVIEIMIAHDTRRSCGTIYEKICAGISILNKLLTSYHIVCTNLGYMTTPELHSSVVIKNNNANELKNIKYEEYGESMKKSILDNNIDISNVVIDCANGVGAVTLKKILTSQKSLIINTNTNDHHLLNENCGSDFIINNYEKIRISEHQPQHQHLLHASFDGDADRIIFYYIDGVKNQICIMDGDHISFLILKYVVNALEKHSIEKQNNDVIKIGIVHTAYSNGGFMDAIDCIKEIIKTDDSCIKIDRVCVPTGIKNLIKVAKGYDIGIYFESNGHGSIMVNKTYDIPELFQIDNIFNRFIGDSIGNLLGVCHILKQLNINNNEFFDLIQKKEVLNTKVLVKNKNIYVTNYDQTILLEPFDIALNVKNIIGLEKFKGCRAFVRPSGTEDILRLYVENNSKNNANIYELSSQLKNIMY